MPLTSTLGDREPNNLPVCEAGARRPQALSQRTTELPHQCLARQVKTAGEAQTQQLRLLVSLVRGQPRAGLRATRTKERSSIALQKPRVIPAEQLPAELEKSGRSCGTDIMHDTSDCAEELSIVESGPDH